MSVRVSVRVRWTGPVSWFAAAVIAGCSSTPEAPTEAVVSREVVVEATVCATSAETREITLERPDGTRFVVIAGPEVRNFDRIEVGNTVTARYVESISARLLGAEEADTETTVGLAVARAEAGADPAAGVAAGLALTVVVQSVDSKQHLVVFTDPAGELYAVRAQRDEGRRFVAGLKAGDRVELIFGEAVVLTVD